MACDIGVTPVVSSACTCRTYSRMSASWRPNSTTSSSVSARCASAAMRCTSSGPSGVAISGKSYHERRGPVPPPARLVSGRVSAVYGTVVCVVECRPTRHRAHALSSSPRPSCRGPAAHALPAGVVGMSAFLSFSRRSVAVAFACHALVACGRSTPEGQGPGGPPGGMPAMGVEVVTLATKPVEETTEYIGTVKSRRSITIQPQVEGFLTRIAVRSGDRVRSGTVLMEIDAGRQEAAVATLEAQRAARESDLAYWKQQSARLETLLKAGAVSQQEYDQAMSTLRSGEAQLAGHRSADSRAARRTGLPPRGRPGGRRGRRHPGAGGRPGHQRDRPHHRRRQPGARGLPPGAGAAGAVADGRAAGAHRRRSRCRDRDHRDLVRRAVGRSADADRCSPRPPSTGRARSAPISSCGLASSGARRRG